MTKKVKLVHVTIREDLKNAMHQEKRILSAKMGKTLRWEDYIAILNDCGRKEMEVKLKINIH